MRLLVSYPDAYVFEEPHRKEPGKNRLTICAHGYRNLVTIGGSVIRAHQIAALIPQWTAIAHLRTVRLISCDSTNPSAGPVLERIHIPFGHAYSDSTGARLSNALPGVVIKSYVGGILMSCSTDLIEICTQIAGPVFVENALSANHWIYKDGITSHFHCITFLNGIAIRQSYPILHENGQDYAVL
jgi:hypothetical protein